MSEEDIEDMDSAIDGDKPLLNRPVASSISSSSNSEEVFLSDGATEENRVLHLEGISVLLGDTEPLVKHNQTLTGQNNYGKPMQPMPLIDVSSLLKEGEGDMEASQLPNDVPSNESSKSLEGGAVEWRKVEDILSCLGLQLIPTNKTGVTEGSIVTASRKKGFRELQNLKFNVNYDCGGCSRGTQSSP